MQKVKVPEQDYFTESKRDQNKQMFTESESAKFVYNFFCKKWKCQNKIFTESKRDLIKKYSQRPLPYLHQDNQMFTESESAKPGFLQRQNKKEWKVKVPAHV